MEPIFETLFYLGCDLVLGIAEEVLADILEEFVHSVYSGDFLGFINRHLPDKVSISDDIITLGISSDIETWQNKDGDASHTSG